MFCANSHESSSCSGFFCRRVDFFCTGTAAARGRPENVISGSRVLSMASPMPRTLPSASSEPNAPNESRFATMRCASDAPIRGNFSSCSVVAMSTSIVPGDASLVFATRRAAAEVRLFDDELFVSFLVRLPDFFARLLLRAPSMADNCPSTDSAPASNAAVVFVEGCRCCHARTPPPSSATPARNARACRSAAVGIGRNMPMRRVDHDIV